MAVNQQAVDIQLTIKGNSPKIIFTNTTGETLGEYDINFYSDLTSRKNRFIGDVIKDGLNS